MNKNVNKTGKFSEITYIFLNFSSVPRWEFIAQMKSVLQERFRARKAF